MRTQALPEGCRNERQHQQRRHAAQEGRFGFWFFMCVVLLVQARSATRSPSRPEGRSVRMDQHDEGKDVRVVAAQHAAGQGADVARPADGLDQPQQHAADHAPARLPMPPNTAAVKAFRPGRSPWCAAPCRSWRPT